MSETWTISVGGRAYGPYTGAQMRAFAAEGRLAPHSLVARSGAEQYAPASEDADLSQIFEPVAAEPATAPAFYTAEGDATHRFGEKEEETSSVEPSRFLVLADMKSRSIAGLEEEIFNLGPAFAVMPQAWLLTSQLSLNAVRNALIQKLGKLDTIFIADTTHDKAAWFNFGMESDSRIRRTWLKVAEPVRRAG